MNTFEKLGVRQTLIDAIKKDGIIEPTQVQMEAIPAIIAGKDVLGQSATGSGKTLAFGLGILMNAAQYDKRCTLILTPTREIAHQVCDVINGAGTIERTRAVAVYGGVSIGPQIDAMKQAHIIVGTPGRIMDHMERGTLDLRNIKMFVLDEADKMFDMGFIDDIRKIMGELPKERQMLLFSATFSYDIMQVATRYMREYVKIEATQQVDPTKLTQIYYDVEDKFKFSLLCHLLHQEKTDLTLIFSNTKHHATRLTDSLKEQGFKVAAIHGGFTQQKRMQSLELLKKGKVDMLVCSDVAARGLDIPGVSHVINYDIPINSKDYVHRIGRTARAGADGLVINILSSRDHDNFGRILRDFSELDIPQGETPQVPYIPMAPAVRDDDRGFGGRGRSGGSRGGFGGGRGRDSGRSGGRDGDRRGGSSDGRSSGGSSYGGRSSSAPRRSSEGGSSSYGGRSSDNRSSGSGSSAPRRSSEGGSSSYGGRSSDNRSSGSGSSAPRRSNDSGRSRPSTGRSAPRGHQ